MKKTKTVVIAGHFNPLHIGHLQLIYAAKELGEKLVVIVANNIQAKKKRPRVFMSEEHRAMIMASIKGVEYSFVSMDTDADVCMTLRVLKPDIFASGCSENHPDAKKEAKVCKELGIKVFYNVGGKKIESSSKLLRKYENPR